MTPNEVDEHEVWQIAAALGVNRAPKEGGEETGGPAADVDPIPERARAAREGRKLDPRSLGWGQRVTTLRPAPPAEEKGA